PALLGYAFQGWYYHFSAGAYITKKTTFFVRATVLGSVIAVVVNFLAVPVYGMLGAAWATASAYAAMALYLLWLIRPHYPVPYPWGRSIGLVGLAAGLLMAWSWTGGLQVWWIELAGLALYGAVSAATLAASLRR
ncbi:MAG: polysaccharide biosynthesis protein, partial [Rhodothermales bacterium]|nr:polysaccharide biosynthesis protein [Rhodothermales bacterium]